MWKIWQPWVNNVFCLIFGLLSCCGSQPFFSFAYLTDCVTFTSRICWCLVCVMFPVLLAAAQLQSRTFPPPCLTVCQGALFTKCCSIFAPNTSFGGCGQRAFNLIFPQHFCLSVCSAHIRCWLLQWGGRCGFLCPCKTCTSVLHHTILCWLNLPSGT